MHTNITAGSRSSCDRNGAHSAHSTDCTNTNYTLSKDQTSSDNPTTAELILALAAGALFLGASVMALISQNVAFATSASDEQSNKRGSAAHVSRHINYLPKVSSAASPEREVGLLNLKPIDYINLNVPVSPPAASK